MNIDYVLMMWFITSCLVFGILELVRDYIMSKTRKVGGIYFTRIGRVQLSFCLCKQAK